MLLNLGSMKREKLQKIKYLENKKSFVDEMKKHFSFGRAIIGEKIKNNRQKA